MKSEALIKPKNHADRTFFSPLFMMSLVSQKWAVLLLLSITLTLLLVPQLHLSPPQYGLGTILDQDIRAEREFLMEDRNATEAKRLEVSRTLEPVFDYDRDLPTSIGLKLTEAFSTVEENYYRSGPASKDPSALSARPELMKQIKQEFEQTAGVRLSDRELEALHRHGFSSSVRNHILQLLNEAYHGDVMSHEDFLRLRDQRKGIILRNPKTFEEEIRRSFASISDIEETGTQLDRASQSLFGREHEALRTAAVSLSLKLVQPNVIFNKSATEKRRKGILNQIKPVYHKIPKNELLAQAGEPLTQADVNKLEAYFGGEEGSRVRLTFLVGIFLTVFLLAFIFYRMSLNLVNETGQSLKDVLFLSLLAIIQVILIRAGIFISTAVSHAFPFLGTESIYFVLPFAVSTLMVAVFLNRYTAFIYAIFSTVLITFLFEDKVLIFLFAFLGSAASAYHIVYFKQRSAFFKSGLFVAGINVILIFCLTLLSGRIGVADTLIRMGMGIAGGMLSGVIVAGITPLFETLFGYTTDIKLLELSNLNQPLLQRLIVEAPGTYHHSIIVSSMVEAAAESIKANSLLAKVSAYYHDIGKLTKPLYFIENQQGWKNKHDKLSPRMSSLVIISHVKDGCELALKFKLGKAITDIIRQHHGMSVVSYFYEKAQKDKDPSVRSIPESDFRYPGPKPQTKEAGLVLLGDVIEASSRTLSDPTPSRIRNLVQSRIKQIFADGQLDECELTLQDVNCIAESFVRTLTGIFHHRIEYSQPSLRQKRESNDHPYHKPTEKNQVRP